MTSNNSRGTPSTEDLLRARLLEVDDLQPPTDDMELRALRAGRDRLKRRQTWTRGVVGVAAAVTIGALAIPTIARLQTGGGVTTSSAASGAAPQAESGAGSAQNSDKAAGSAPLDARGFEVENTLVRLRTTVARAYPESYTALVLDSSVTPRRVVLHMTVDTPAAQRTVRDAIPADVQVVSEASVFSAAQCQATLARVSADRTTLGSQGYALGSTACDVDGRVAVEVTKLVTAEQISALTVRYADAVKVVQVVPVTASPTS